MPSKIGVERPLRMQAAIRIESEVDPQLTVACALRVDYDALRRYKQLRDLLGADRLTDIDHFLLDDATYSNRLQNDLRHPDRTVGEGDRFGYDYRTVRCEVAADGVVRYRSDRWTAAFGASVGRCVVRRRGFYEKELFPGAGSYGGSSRLRFTPYALRASAGYAFSSRSYLEISASASAAVPDVEDLFLQPLYNNRTVDDPSLSRRYGAELVFVRTGGAFELRVTGYLAATRDGIRTTRFFDDLSYEYCDMTVRGIGRLDYGAEAAARLRLTWNWSLSAAVGAGSHTYATNPSVWLYTDAGNELRADGVTSYMSGLRPGGTPRWPRRQACIISAVRGGISLPMRRWSPDDGSRRRSITGLRVWRTRPPIRPKHSLFSWSRSGWTTPLRPMSRRGECGGWARRDCRSRCRYATCSTTVARSTPPTSPIGYGACAAVPRPFTARSLRACSMPTAAARR